MPEVILCKYCKLPINKEADQFVVVDRGTDRFATEHIKFGKRIIVLTAKIWSSGFAQKMRFGRTTVAIYNPPLTPIPPIRKELELRENTSEELKLSRMWAH